MATGIDPKVDYVFKRLCGEEDNALLLVDLLNAILRFPAGRVVRGVTLLNPFVATDFAEGKVPILDVRARDDPGRQFLLEMQMFVRPGFANRLLYYWSGGHAEQLLKGERYELLQPTYAICFLNERLLADDAYHHTFRVFDDKQGVLLCRDLEIHVLELSKFAVQAEEVKTPLERWCYFFKHGASLDLASLPMTLDVSMIRKAVEVLVKLSQNELDRQRYLERQRAERDAASLAADARDARQIGLDEGRELGIEQGIEQGIKQGIKQGIEQGLEKGKRIGRIQLLQQLLQQSEISSEVLNRLSEQELVQMEQSLRQQLNAKKETNGTPSEKT